MNCGNCTSIEQYFCVCSRICSFQFKSINRLFRLTLPWNLSPFSECIHTKIARPPRCCLGTRQTWLLLYLGVNIPSIAYCSYQFKIWSTTLAGYEAMSRRLKPNRNSEIFWMNNRNGVLINPRDEMSLPWVRVYGLSLVALASKISYDIILPTAQRSCF